MLIEPGSFLTHFSDNRKFAKQTESGKSAYAYLTNTFFERFNKANEKVKKGILTKFFDPDKVVNAIYNVSLQKNPSLRHRIGFDAHINYIARKILPPVIWGKIMHTVYKW